MKNQKDFLNPPKKFAPKKIAHNWERYNMPMEDACDEMTKQGYGGVVTNVPYENKFTQNPENLDKLAEIVKVLEKKDFGFWIYDEAGYPSGQAGGLTLEGHPEFASKGMFMYKRFAFSPLRAKYHLPDEADKIVWAAKYKFAENATCLVDFSSIVPVPFEKDYVECDLDDHEALYIFSVKTTHEGTPGMHNVCSHRQNINIMDKNAVKHFIDTAYEPIAGKVPEAYQKCEYVFTDEPSLFVTYTNDKESWTYATAPYADGIFEEYEKEYGESLFPLLPLIYEGGTKAYPTRIKFYELVGKLIASSYSGQLSAWCEEHGCGFSGHYLTEENICMHVGFYGNLIRVLCGASYPGIDILICYPEAYQFVNSKAPQMAVRKGGHNGMMVELCPFFGIDEFNKHPYDNMKCTTALCYLAGARKANSYFSMDLDSPEYEKMHSFNTYTARMNYLLDNLSNDTDLFLYFPIEDAQAKFKPLHTNSWAGCGDTSTKENLDKLVDDIQYAGFDFYFADFEDIAEALKTLSENAKPEISGNSVKTIIVPKMTTMRKSTLDALKTLSENGVRVRFIDALPEIDGETGESFDSLNFDVYERENVFEELYSDGGVFAEKTDKKIIRGKFIDGDKTIYMLVNMEREDAFLKFNCKKNGEIWNPDDGSVTPLGAEENVLIPACRAIFVVA